MPVTTDFHKSKALEYLNALSGSGPFNPPTSIHEWLTLGGACYFMARTMSPPDWPRLEWEEHPKEVVEAREFMRDAETTAAIETFGVFVALVYHEAYSEQLEDDIQVSFYMDGDEPAMKVIKGTKPPK
jgi:hypothetical protein